MKTSKKGSRVGTVFKQVINVRAWFDLERVKGTTSYLAKGLSQMFVPQKKAQGESFSEAVTQNNLSKADLTAKEIALYRLSILMCIFAVLIFGYAIYQLFYGSYRAAGVSIAIMGVALALAFRYHFWYFQIRERKLGCSISEWYKQGLKGGK